MKTSQCMYCLAWTCGLFLAGCKSTGDQSTELKNVATIDTADHQCQVFLASAQYSPESHPGWSFEVAVEPSVAGGASHAFIHYVSDQTNGQWTDLTLARKRDDGSTRYTVFTGFLPIASPYHTMWAQVVAYFGKDGRLFDHNFESGNSGFIELNQSNNWAVSNPSANCRL